MASKKSPKLDGPIAGQSLTAEPGSRPWEQPPKYSTVEDTIEFYIDNMSAPKKMAKLLDKIEEGAPLTLIADTLQAIGVSQGMHSLDVGVLVSPVLIEFMKAAAEQEDISYTIGIEEPEGEVDESLINAAVKSVFKKEKGNDDMETPTEETSVEEAPASEPEGLMARRSPPVEEDQDGI